MLTEMEDTSQKRRPYHSNGDLKHNATLRYDQNKTHSENIKYFSRLFKRFLSLTSQLSALSSLQY